MRKDELVKELYKFEFWNEDEPSRLSVNWNKVAEFILSRETAMLEEIEKPLSLSVMFQESFDDSLGLTEARKALDIIQRRKGDHA
jgi:hypothetical protein